MFGSLGVPELLLIFFVILIVFGPRRIPEIGKTLGKALGDFRRATDDFKSTIEREVRLEELKKVAPPTLESLVTPFESVSRSEPVTFPSAATEATNPETEEPIDAAAPAPAAAALPAETAVPTAEPATPTRSE